MSAGHYASAPAYELPDPLASESEGLRYYHLDLDAMADLPLWAEGQAVERTLYDAIRGPGRVMLTTPEGFQVSGVDWLHSRWTRIRAERQRRAKGGRRHDG